VKANVVSNAINQVRQAGYGMQNYPYGMSYGSYMPYNSYNPYNPMMRMYNPYGGMRW